MRGWTTAAKGPGSAGRKSMSRRCAASWTSGFTGSGVNSGGRPEFVRDQGLTESGGGLAKPLEQFFKMVHPTFEVVHPAFKAAHPVLEVCHPVLETTHPPLEVPHLLANTGNVPVKAY